MKLTIRKILQDSESVDCGPVSVQMILSYFKIERSLADLKKKLSYDAVGTSIFDNGNLVLDEGLKATLIFANPLLFSKNDRKSLKGRSKIVSHISKLIGDKKEFKDRKHQLKILKKFAERGGKVVLEIPEMKHIKTAIDSNSPVIALLYGQAMGEHEGSFHFVVVNGYDDTHVYILNPLKESKLAKVPIQDFFYALYSSTTADIDNGSLLIVSK